MNYDVTALGEVLIDMTPAGKSDKGYQLYESNPGGAPANVLAALSKLGKRTAFIGKVGADGFGTYLRDTLEECGIDTSSLAVTEEANTTMAFVHLSEDGDRSFSFFRKPGADRLLEAGEIDGELLAQSRIFHFGSISMTHEPSAEATRYAVSLAKASGALISFDPNLRMPLWSDAAHAKAMMQYGLGCADVVKISEEELEFLTGTSDLEEGSRQLLETFGIALILVTLAERGSFYRFGSRTGLVSGYRVDTVDTTGAGDAFLGGVLFGLLEGGSRLSALTEEQVRGVVAFANAVGALATTVKGAIPAMPELAAIRRLMDNSR
ncbi:MULTISPECIES: carbohydrate kinase family protein [Paenibacillus]|uniref:carbohydrate kinase family protein n=1 Tax=Paenibacillus TaxID=44249 RepID=UPI0022B88636|nr:carbohydrate kinase [Paenibacillus caseinilyticus]MCZ8518156.1 carbohydrate kinase [Paenibacillus caseinilyticus]